MARRLRFNGTGSGEGGCPSIHEDLDTGEIIVHGPPLTDPESIGRLRHLSPGEVPIVVPRALLVDYGPKEVTRTPHLIDLTAFGRLFEVFEHTAWRLETRRRYASDEATDTYAQFVRGEAPSWDFSSSWAGTIRKKTSSGATVGRVRVVDRPPTPGQRYLLAHAEKNVALGEDIRNMWRDEAERLDLPTEDFWIFDSRLVALLNFDGDDNLVDVELINEPAEVVRYAQLRDRAWHHAVRRDAFTAEVTALG
ncbi:DUF6879 family protein [Streptomyces sudanensis]|uniref:DUF6879 family protein n=1 Tax=Streptomyces sudanensis TaxID=436397 RepID=UPI0020CFBBF6|nr:DUF6879 family protein [Streptomyces sudanensis]MCP9958628.1 hypothetical protein [Streptomyces sudanensis]MCP9987733.1 hypothetical protein [Streptomyces sudanensis]MCQ0000873.1 hypothetical protein [Streptomyces sudanensis]